MIEVLVTLMIVAFAMLGAAALQAMALRYNKASQFRSQAVFLAGDLSERMEANSAAAVAGAYVMTTSSNPVNSSANCVANACTPDQVAQSDLAQWQSAIAQLLPQGSWAVKQTTSGNPSTYTIVLSWQERSSGDVASGTTENFSYTSTRTVATQ